MMTKTNPLVCPGFRFSISKIAHRLELHTIHGLLVRIGNSSVTAERRTYVTAPAAGVARIARVAATAGGTTALVHVAESRHSALGILQHDTAVVINVVARVERSL